MILLEYLKRTIIALDEFVNTGADVWQWANSVSALPSWFTGTLSANIDDKPITALYNIASIMLDNTTLTQKGSVTEVCSNELSYFFNEDTQILTVHFENGFNPHACTSVVYYTIKFGMTNGESKVYNDVLYINTLKTVPSVQKSVEPFTYEAIQTETLTLTLVNDEISEVQNIDGNKVVRKYHRFDDVSGIIGMEAVVKYINSDDYSDAVLLYKGYVSDYAVSADEFDMTLSDYRTAGNVQFPQNTFKDKGYTSTNVGDDTLESVVPDGFGKCNRMSAKCVTNAFTVLKTDDETDEVLNTPDSLISKGISAWTAVNCAVFDTATKYISKFQIFRAEASSPAKMESAENVIPYIYTPVHILSADIFQVSGYIQYGVETESIQISFGDAVVAVVDLDGCKASVDTNVCHYPRFKFTSEDFGSTLYFSFEISNPRVSKILMLKFWTSESQFNAGTIPVLYIANLRVSVPEYSQFRFAEKCEGTSAPCIARAKSAVAISNNEKTPYEALEYVKSQYPIANDRLVTNLAQYLNGDSEITAMDKTATYTVGSTDYAIDGCVLDLTNYTTFVSGSKYYVGQWICGNWALALEELTDSILYPFGVTHTELLDKSYQHVFKYSTANSNLNKLGCSVTVPTKTYEDDLVLHSKNTQMILPSNALLALLSYMGITSDNDIEAWLGAYLPYFRGSMSIDDIIAYMFMPKSAIYAVEYSSDDSYVDITQFVRDIVPSEGIIKMHECDAHSDGLWSGSVQSLLVTANLREGDNPNTIIRALNKLLIKSSDEIYNDADMSVESYISTVYGTCPIGLYMDTQTDLYSVIEKLQNGVAVPFRYEYLDKITIKTDNPNRPAKLYIPAEYFANRADMKISGNLTDYADYAKISYGQNGKVDEVPYYVNKDYQNEVLRKYRNSNPVTIDSLLLTEESARIKSVVVMEDMSVCRPTVELTYYNISILKKLELYDIVKVNLGLSSTRKFYGERRMQVIGIEVDTTYNVVKLRLRERAFSDNLLEIFNEAGGQLITEYALGDSDVEHPDGNTLYAISVAPLACSETVIGFVKWSSVIPVPSANQFVWQRVSADGGEHWEYSLYLIEETVTTEYGISATNTGYPPTNAVFAIGENPVAVGIRVIGNIAWKSEVPVPSAGEYIWRRQRIGDGAWVYSLVD